MKPKVGDRRIMGLCIIIPGIIDAENKRISLVPATSVEQDNSASSYINSQDDGETYNPFAALLKK